MYENRCRQTCQTQCLLRAASKRCDCSQGQHIGMNIITAYIYIYIYFLLIACLRYIFRYYAFPHSHTNVNLTEKHSILFNWNINQRRKSTYLICIWRLIFIKTGTPWLHIVNDAFQELSWNLPIISHLLIFSFCFASIITRFV